MLAPQASARASGTAINTAGLPLKPMYAALTKTVATHEGRPSPVTGDAFDGTTVRSQRRAPDGAHGRGDVAIFARPRRVREAYRIEGTSFDLGSAALNLPIPKNTVTVGEIIEEEYRKPLGLTQQQFADALTFRAAAMSRLQPASVE